MEVELVLPLHVSDAALVTSLDPLVEFEEKLQAGTTQIFFLTLRVHPSRVLWTTLRPLFFELSPRQARRALRCILHQCFDWDAIIIEAQHARLQRGRAPSGEGSDLEANDDLDGCVPNRNALMIQRRRLKLSSFAARNRTRRKIFLLIRPPDTVQVEYLFAGLVICWEHRLIQAQSLSGYIATLGGGFFLCHHFQTAILLARQQQRMALFLNDESMYYTCFVHQAYSHIYAGNFRTALSILRQVLQVIQPSSDVPSSDPVLVKMCLSARLFCKRMRRASRVVASPSNEEDQANDAGTVSTTIDDYQRVRVVRDKSKVNELVIPFSRASSR